MKAILSSLFCTLLFFSCTPSLGEFEGQADVGNVVIEGEASYDAARQSYTVTGGGENMWTDTDEFHFVWKKISGDVSIAANINILDEGIHPHRKGFVTIRQDLDSDAAYASAVIHGNGMASLQYREGKGGQTHEVQSNINAPKRLRLEKAGKYVSMQVGDDVASMRSSGGSFRMALTAPYYIGIGVCAHDSTRAETAVFSNVEIDSVNLDMTAEPVLESTLERIDIASTDRTVVYHTEGHIEAPNWTHDGQYFIFNSEGLLYKLPVGGGEPVQIDTGILNGVNNDHGISPDASQLVISDGSQGDHGSRVYLMPFEGGTPRLITPEGPSYWHGWSPDGKTLAYVARRGGADHFDIYTIPVTGGRETRITDAEGLDDGPDYTPDGAYIYFNSVRTGTMQIYRMKPDGSEQEQITFDEYNDWFPHPSPDGMWIVFVSFEPDVEGHPANKDVMLRLMPIGGGEVQTIAKLFGGQGTINVPSWSPDSKHVAFVSYRLVYPEKP